MYKIIIKKKAKNLLTSSPYSVDHGILTVFVIDAGNRGEIYSRY